MLKVLDVDGAVRRVNGGWEATGQPWTYDAERYARVAGDARRASSRRCSATPRRTGAAWSSCARELDDPEASPVRSLRQLHGTGLDRAGGRPAGTEAPGEAARAEAARARLRRPGVEVEPRKMWPSGMKDLGIGGASGKIPAELLAEAGPRAGQAQRHRLGHHAARAAGAARAR